jgi:hypothetical protein
LASDQKRNRIEIVIHQNPCYLNTDKHGLDNPKSLKPPLVNLIVWATRVGWVASNALPEFAARAKLSYIAATPFKENLVFAPQEWERRGCVIRPSL